MIYIVIASVAAAVIAITWAVAEHIKTRKLVNSLSDMLDSAIEGDFSETSFDESVYSLLES